MSALPDHSEFLSGEAGQIVGPRLTARATVTDLVLNARAALARTGRRLDRLAERAQSRTVLVLSIYRPGSRLPGAVPALRSDRHEVRLAFGATSPGADPELALDTALTDLEGGKFENLNRLVEAAGNSYDWVLVTDDDVELPPRFLDRFVALCDALGLDLAQPAQTSLSHAAWAVTRRRPGIARITNFVEIGPVTAFSRRAAGEFLPFPPLRFGWGLDSHWGAVARERGWTLGVIDALPVRHEWQQIATNYTHAEAIKEAREFMAGKPYVTRAEAQQTLQRIGRVPQTPSRPRKRGGLGA